MKRLDPVDRAVLARTNPEAAMTTYPLSELATIYAIEGNNDEPADVVGRGTLAECVSIIADLAPNNNKAVSIQMDDFGLRFRPEEVSELMKFLREEVSGLSNVQVVEIKGLDT